MPRAQRQGNQLIRSLLFNFYGMVEQKVMSLQVARSTDFLVPRCRLMTSHPALPPTVNIAHYRPYLPLYIGHYRG